MTVNPHIPRRTALTAGLAGVGAVALAACGSSGSSEKTQAGTGNTDSSGASASSSSSSSSSAASSAGSSGASSGAGASVDAIAKLADITIGQTISATIDGEKVLVSRPTATTAACFSAKCTHQGCTVKPAGAKLDCPCHGSVFNALTGAVEGGPAPSPLPSIAVKVVDGSVVKA